MLIWGGLGIALLSTVAMGQQVRAKADQQWEQLQRKLADFNRLRFAPELTADSSAERLRNELEHRTLETRWLEVERERVADVARGVPTQPSEFVDWFQTLRDASARHHSFYQWLAEQGDRHELAWLLAQEAASNEALEDLLALVQLQLPWRAKLEIARCYWDEMGQGQAAAMRSRILDDILREIRFDATEAPLPESLARGNLMFALACNRSHAYQAIGALGALELGAAGKARLLSLALKRLGFSVQASAYFASRSKLGILRAHSWESDVIMPLVAQDSRIAVAIAEGALLRLALEERAILRYQRELALPSAAAPLPRPALVR